MLGGLSPGWSGGTFRGKFTPRRRQASSWSRNSLSGRGVGGWRSLAAGEFRADEGAHAEGDAQAVAGGFPLLKLVEGQPLASFAWGRGRRRLCRRPPRRRGTIRRTCERRSVERFMGVDINQVSSGSDWDAGVIRRPGGARGAQDKRFGRESAMNSGQDHLAGRSRRPAKGVSGCPNQSPRRRCEWGTSPESQATGEER